MAYEEMKATKKSSKSDSAKKAIGSMLDSLSKNKSSTTKRKNTSSSSSKPKTTKSSQSSANKTANSRTKSSTKTANSSTNRRKTTTNSQKTTLIDVSLPIITKQKSSKKSNHDSGSSNKKNTKSSLTLFVIILFLAIGVIGGFFATKFICANDVYEMVAYSNGEYDITIGEHESISNYTELGVKCVAFGKDCSKNYKVDYYYRNNMTEDEVLVSEVGEKGEGIYYAVYTAPSKKYITVKLIRNIIVLRGEDDEI